MPTAPGLRTAAPAPTAGAQPAVWLLQASACGETRPGLVPVGACTVSSCQCDGQTHLAGRSRGCCWVAERRPTGRWEKEGPAQARLPSPPSCQLAAALL